MKPFGYAAAILFAAVALLHLTACLIHRDGIRKASKVFLVPLIAVIHIGICGFSHPLVIAALAFGFIGDVLLIPGKNKTCFALGGFSFLIGHILYITHAFREGLPQKTYALWGIPSVIAIVCLALLFCVLAYLTVARKLGRLRIPVTVYMAALAAMAGTMVYIMPGSGFSAPALLLAAGGVHFAVSDFLLCSGSLRALRIKNNRFFVMLTYIIAQTCLALGFALM